MAIICLGPLELYIAVTRSSLISNKLKGNLFKNDGTELRHRIF